MFIIKKSLFFETENFYYRTDVFQENITERVNYYGEFTIIRNEVEIIGALNYGFKGSMKQLQQECAFLTIFFKIRKEHNRTRSIFHMSFVKFSTRTSE